MTPLKKITDREEERAGGRMDGWTNERKDAVKGSAQSCAVSSPGLWAPDLVHIFAIVAMF